MDNVTVIYTPWSNLNKTKGMVTGQVGFKKANLVKKIYIGTRINAIINRLNKTRIERFPNLQEERVTYEKDQKRKEIEERQKRKKEDQRIAKERMQLAYNKDHAYDDLFTDENIRHSSNSNADSNLEDDFW